MHGIPQARHGKEGGRRVSERQEGGKGSRRKEIILRQVACETLLRVAFTMIWEARGLCVGCEVMNQDDEAAMRAGPNEETMKQGLRCLVRK